MRFTLFRPFNWIGPKLDDLTMEPEKEGSSRVVTQFISNLIHGDAIRLVDGGEQKRCFTYVDDGIDGLMRIIENKNDVCNGEIFNIGNPRNEATIRELAYKLRDIFMAYKGNAGKKPVRDSRGLLRRLLRQGVSGHRPQGAVDQEGAGDPRVGAEGGPRYGAAQDDRILPGTESRRHLMHKVIGLEVHVDTFEGMRHGVGRLLDLFDSFGVHASFFVPMGKDHTGWTVKRVFTRPGFISKAQRVGVLETYGVKTLMRGLLLPGAQIAKRNAGLLRGHRGKGT